MRNPALLLFGLIVAPWLPAAAPAVSAASAEPSPLFHLDFDAGFDAKARGPSAPAAGSVPPRRADGVSGQAAAFQPGQHLRYAAEGNLAKSAGAISFWFRPPAGDEPQMKGVWTLFSEDAPDDAGSNRLRIELQADRFLRVSLKDPRDSTVTYPHLARLPGGTWHHVAVTWNSNKGALIYINGQPAAISWVRSWTPQEHTSFRLGTAEPTAAHKGELQLDEVQIFGHELTEDTVRQLYQQFGSFAVTAAIQDAFVDAEQPGSVRLALFNPADQPATVTGLRLEVRDASGARRHEATLESPTVGARDTTTLPLPLPALPAGTYDMQVTYQENGSRHVTQADLLVMAPQQPPASRPAQQTRLAHIDAAATTPIAESGESRIVQSPLGVYREAGAQTHDRFAIDFTVEESDQPHLAVIRYPDDKPRTMEVMLQDFSNTIDFQVHTGIYAGDEFPNSQQMLEHRVIFWPRSSRQAFIFMTAEDGYPAAVESIEIFRLHEFPVTETSHHYQGPGPARSTGLYYEDPVLFLNFGTGRDLAGFTAAVDRLVQYLRSFGQTEFEYPLAWYAGPLYGTSLQRFQPDIDGGQGGVRPHPPGYPLYLLQRLQEHGIKFTAGLHIHTLPSLDQYALADLERIAQGEETAININKDGELWYGHWHGRDVNYNPADPRVMAAVDAVVDEVVTRYGREPAFDGVSLVMARPKLFTFGSLDSGYNDTNLVRFQTDSGITIPVYQRHDRERFAKSYAWLMSQPEAKEAWIDWRCRLLYERYVRMSERITAVRSDLKLKLNLFLHPSHNARLADYANQSSLQVMREMGFDPRLYQGHPSIILNATVVPADLRWMRRSEYLPETPGVSRAVFTSPEIWAPLREHDNVRVTIHDRYWEDAIGKEHPLPGLQDVGVQEMVWRASTLNPARFHSLEPYMFAVHQLDATSIVKGGYVVGTFGMEQELVAFSGALQTLPAVRFNDVPSAVDPVRVRQQVVDGRLYFYVLNTLPERVEAELTLREAAPVEELTNGKRLARARSLPLRLAPYELRTFASDSATQSVTGATTKVPEAWQQALERRYQTVRRAAEAQEATARTLSPYLERAQQAWQAGHFSRLYFLLQEHWAQELARGIAPSAASAP